jgi:hypothetical protein
VEAAGVKGEGAAHHHVQDHAHALKEEEEKKTVNYGAIYLQIETNFIIL